MPAWRLLPKLIRRPKRSRPPRSRCRTKQVVVGRPGFALMLILGACSEGSDNKGSTPTFVARIGQSIIDLTFTSNNLQNTIKDWQVLTEPSHSDHRYITAKIYTKQEEEIIVRPIAKTNWTTFQQLLRTGWSNQQDVWSQEDIEKAVTELYDRINSALNTACPLRRIKPVTKLTK